MIEILLFLVKTIPVVLPLLWILGSLAYYLGTERKSRINLSGEFPALSVLIPCHNEEKTIALTIESLDHLDYPHFEVIAIDDGSKDQTLNVLHQLSESRPWLRVLHMEKNRGKAGALNLGLMVSQHEYLLCIDADSELDPQAARWMVQHFLADSSVGAVTGNPRVKNRGTLIGRIQVGEFSAIIGLIKRYQQVIGKLFTVSGVIVMFRKTALLDVGMWDTETVTEDIGVSWKLQTRHWDLRYEPHAICDVLMPDTLKGLWKQRLRWAQGGFEVMMKHSDVLWSTGHRRLKLIYCEYVFSVLWTYAFPLVLVLGWTMKNPQGHPLWTEWFLPLNWAVFITGIMSLFQFTAGLLIHGRYEKNFFQIAYWTIWYPFVYWSLNSLVLFVAIPKVIFGRKRKFSTWVSPDRGGITYDQQFQ